MVCFRLTTFHSGITLGQLLSLWLEGEREGRDEDTNN